MSLHEELQNFILKNAEDGNALETLLEKVTAENYPKESLVPLLHVLENNPTHHFGEPGNVVRAIEKHYQESDYFDLILQSIERVPTEYNLWLLNRVMNTFDYDDDADFLKRGLSVFHKVEKESDIEGLKEIAREFIENFDE